MIKTVFITGGSRGIGAEAVRLFSKNGYRVAFSYLNSESKALSLAKECGALAVKCDISKSDSVKDAVGHILGELGRIDVLINNAGVSEFSLFTDITDEMWDRMIGTNLSGAFYVTRALLPQMISRKSGVIINVSSMWGEVGASCEAHYSAAKAGLIGMTKSLAKEVGPSGIRVNCVTPGVIRTEMNAHLSDDDIEALKNDTPLGKIGEPSDIANALLYLASDNASFITGQILGVSGGMII